MYLFELAYPAAKALLQSRVGFRVGIRSLIDQCRGDFSSPLWDEMASCDYEEELNRLIKWWPAPGDRESPADDVEVLFIALEDFPEGFTLRGSTRWSRDPENWEWWYDDDYSGPHFNSTIMECAFERAEIHDRAKPFKKQRSQHTPRGSWEVISKYFSLGYFGLLVRELIRRSDHAQFLGNRSSRWFVIGHPDAVYGIIMGKLTKSRWQIFHR